MNYIEQFMDDNGLSVGTCFKIDKLSGEYVFDEDFVLWKKCRQDVSEIASVALAGLLTGRCQPVTKMGQVAEILGVKLGERFLINTGGEGLSTSQFAITKNGLETDPNRPYPVALMKLLTGEYKITPIKQEEA